MEAGLCRQACRSSRDAIVEQHRQVRLVASRSLAQATGTRPYLATRVLVCRLEALPGTSPFILLL